MDVVPTAYEPNDSEPGAQELIAARPAFTADALDGLLFEGVALAAVAQAHGTPVWVMGSASLRARLARLRRALPEAAIHYAVKANDQLAVLRLLADEGAGADVVSIGECRRALLAGVPAERIVMSGVGKTGAELAAALAADIGQINVESEEELFELAALAAGSGRRARVAIRVNPDVAAGTLDGISTGRAGDKFGVPIGDVAGLYAAAQAMAGIEMVGLAVHIGSQIQRMAPFAAAYGRIAGLVRSLRACGLAVEVVDCGGGLGIPYADELAIPPEAWAGCIRAAFGSLGVRLAIEPGRWLAGPAGVLLASVVRVRRAGMVRPVVILDAAMNDLVRPAMYGAFHAILPVSAAGLMAAPERMPEYVDVAGPVCESSDMFARGRLLAPMRAGDTVAILDSGAYGSVMSSTYNARPLVAGVMTDRAAPGGFVLTRRRAGVESLWAGEMA